MKKTRLIIADDHQIVREGLKNLLIKEHDLEIIAEAENGLEAIKLASALEPDIVIMDIGMPDLNGIEATRQIISEYPNIRILALSMHTTPQYITNMFNAGAQAYLLKDCAFDELVDAIRSLARGKRYISPSISDFLPTDFWDTIENKQKKSEGELSEREKQVLQLLTEGNSTKEIGEKLHISAKTVESHRKRIMQKLKLYTIPDLTKYAIRVGLTTLDP